MTNRVCLISDSHFGIKKGSDVFIESQLRFFKEQFVPYLKEQGISTIFFLGDLFDNRNSLNIKIKNDIFDLFENYLIDFEIYLIIGNHDAYYNTNINIHSLKFFSKFQNINIIDKTTTIQKANKNILLSPWIVDFLEFKKELVDSVDLCFGHFDIKGFHFDKFRLSEHGIDPTIFPKNCKKVFTGHFHTRSKQTINNTEIVYIGSPYQLSRADIAEERGFVVIDLDTNKYEFINNNKSLKYIKLKYPEMFTKNRIKNNIIDIHINKSEIYEEDKIHKYIETVESYYPAEYPNTFIIDDSDFNSNLNGNNINIDSITDLIKIYVDSLNIENKIEIYNTLMSLYKIAKGEIQHE